MRCLHCGKELALLRRLTGHGDFCSEDHKQSYQEEYNRLALSRLLQAQKKGQQANNSPVQNAAPPPASVAVEEPLAEDGAAEVVDATVLESGHTEALTQTEAQEAAIDSSANEYSTPELDTSEELAPGEDLAPGEEPEPETSLDAEPEPLESAGFLFDGPAVSALPEETPYLEPWLELLPGPAMSEWQSQNGAFGLSSGDLLTLDLRLKSSSIEEHAVAADLSPQAFTSAPGPSLPLAAPGKKTTNASRLTAGGPIPIEIEPKSAPSDADQSLVQGVQFESVVEFEDSQLLDLASTVIDFPTEDSNVVFLAHSDVNKASLALAPSAEEQAAPSVDNTPRASLEALSRLHQELVEKEAATAPAEPPAEPVAPPVAPARSEIVELAPEVVEPMGEEPGGKFATDLFEIPIKLFPPAKPALIAGDAYPSHAAPLLPHLKFLPLRPKIAIATGYVPPSQTAAPSEAKAPTSAAAPVRGQSPSPSKGAVSGKPAARLTQPKQPAPSAKPAPPAAKAPEARTSTPPKAAVPKTEVTKPVAKPAVAKPGLSGQSAAGPSVPEAPPKTPPAETQPPAPDQPKAAVEVTKPAVDEPKPAAAIPKPKADQSNKDQSNKDDIPHFGSAQPTSASWAGSLKVKLGIAIALLVIACAYFLGWGGGKSGKLAGSSTGIATDGSGPSIIMGEGGWVEGWGGDPSGIHAGRQITIYRPSLKLSDYRIEFQGSIDTKSIGWVFRAADPNNYYAMKLMSVSSGLTPKVALFKYLVANEKQTQVGRVPIDLAVQPDTVFGVRVDVRGPKFTTYIQGQQVDSWTDDQLKVGGVGFLNERDERGKVKSVSIRYLSGASK
jgi:hypothetical protein